MENCFRCEISESHTQLYDAITEEGIVKVCEKCAFDEGIPIIKKPTTIQLKESERKHSVYERLSNAAGINPEKRKEQFIKKEDTSLKEIVNRNYQDKNKNTIKKERPDLVDNFHWTIMRARRLKKLTQEQLAKEINESEAAIRMAERGILPEDDYKLISKIQSFLNVRLMKRETEKDIKSLSKEISFDPFSTKEITIGEIRPKTEIVHLSNSESTEELVERDIKELEELKPKRGIFGRIKDFFTIEEETEEAEKKPEEDNIAETRQATSQEKEETKKLTEEEVKEQVKRDLKENLLRRTEQARPAQKKNLSQKEIDDLIFGRKKQ